LTRHPGGIRVEMRVLRFVQDDKVLQAICPRERWSSLAGIVVLELDYA